MQGYQNLQEKLDIKILILFVLRHLPDAVSGTTLADLALSEGNVGYFEYAECLSELVDSGHVEKNGSMYKITERGKQNCEIVETSLPFTVRSKLKEHCFPVAEEMRRRAMIGASHELDGDTCRVHLSLSDGLGEILDMHILCAGEEQAKTLEANFTQSAEQYYTEIMEVLLRNEKV